MEEKTTEQIAEEAAEAAAAAPEAGAAAHVQEAIDQAAESAASTDPAVEAKLKEANAKLKEALAALKSRNEADAEALAAEEKSLLDELSEGDPVRWGAIYAKMKKAGKIGKPAASAQLAPEADRTRISSESGQPSAPATIEEARAGALGALERI